MSVRFSKSIMNAKMCTLDGKLRGSPVLKIVTGERKARIRRIRKNNTVITRLGRGRYSLSLVLDHQSFRIMDEGYFTSRERAWWYATQAAIALNRFKFGD